MESPLEQRMMLKEIRAFIQRLSLELAAPTISIFGEFAERYRHKAFFYCRIS
jgi:hypothetical protein